jgi:hypothetical protein
MLPYVPVSNAASSNEHAMDSQSSYQERDQQVKFRRRVRKRRQPTTLVSGGYEGHFQGYGAHLHEGTAWQSSPRSSAMYWSMAVSNTLDYY